MALFNQTIPAINSSYINQNNNIPIPYNISVTELNPSNPNATSPAPKQDAVFGNAQCGVSSLGMLLNTFFIKKRKPIYNKNTLADLYKYDTKYKNNIYQDRPVDVANFNFYANIIKNEFVRQGIVTSINQFGNLASNHKYDVTVWSSQNNGDTILQKDGYLDIIYALALHESPVVFPTSLYGDGHFILITGYDSQSDSFIVNDPFGEVDFATNKLKTIQSKERGKGVKYPVNQLVDSLQKWTKKVNEKTGQVYYVKYHWAYINDWDVYRSNIE